jgi:Ser/Thr protein kinase RdoA (MazF antagonist)
MQRARDAGLTIVPVVYRAKQGATWVEHDGRCWEALSWQPGRADFAENPSPARLRSACTALARLHDAWATPSWEKGICPAIQRRLARTAEWSQLVASGWRESLAARRDDPLRLLVEKAWFLLADRAPRVPRLLAPFEPFKVPLQPCLCDVWHDHLLFEGDTLTGLVDFGGVKIDHVSVDLARMLGSLVGDDANLWSIGLEAYREIRAFSAEEEQLARVLDVTGTIVGLVNWLLWIYRDGRQYDDWQGVARRMKALIERLERRS